MKSIVIPILTLALTGSLLGLTSCSEGHSEEVKNAPAFCLTDTLKSQLTLDTARTGPVLDELKLSGKITYNEDKIVKVFPLVGGTVEDLKVELGDYVRKGQVLAIIRSGEIADFENQLVTAQSNLAVSRKNLDVAEDMYGTGLTAEKDLVAARKDVLKAEGDLKRIQEVLRIYGVGTGSVYSVKAPIAGFVVEKNITESMQFRGDNVGNLFTISDLDEIWTMANVYESDISKVKLGYEAEITTLSYPDEVFKGKIDRIFNALDPANRVMKVRIRMHNKDYRLKPEMFANVTVRYAEDKQMLQIPVGDVIFDKNRNYVMVYHSACSLETRQVEVEKTAGAVSYIRSGLKPGETVMARNKLLVYDALND